MCGDTTDKANEVIRIPVVNRWKPIEVQQRSLRLRTHPTDRSSCTYMEGVEL